MEMKFKGLDIEVGDFVAFKTDEVPLPEVQASVVSVSSAMIRVISTLIAPFGHNGRFTESDVSEIKVVYPAEIAIPQESRGKRFRKDQIVSVKIKGKEHLGNVIAAFDGIVVAQRADGEFLTGGASHFSDARCPV